MSMQSRAFGISIFVGVFLVSGCATTPEEQQQMGGAALGCVAGGLLGAAIGNRRGAVAGCVAGAAVGWGTVRIAQYQANQTRSSNADMRQYKKQDPDFYGHRGVVGASAVKIRGARSAPDMVARGSTVKVSTDYSVVTPPGVDRVDVTETIAVKKDGQLLFSTPPASEQRTQGGWTSDGSFEIPKEAGSGTYIVEHKVAVADQYDTRISSFVVQ